MIGTAARVLPREQWIPWRKELGPVTGALSFFIKMGTTRETYTPFYEIKTKRKGEQLYEYYGYFSKDRNVV